jgi:uncharacterized radical SAM superfamily Fe-S cluster-containing enzyme
MSLRQTMLEREQIANRRKHWVRAVTACNSRCVFCLDMDTPRNVFLPVEEIQAELRRGREELDADKVIISGGEATLHPEFSELVRYGRSIGYERVQTVTSRIGTSTGPAWPRDWARSPSASTATPPSFTTGSPATTARSPG